MLRTALGILLFFAITVACVPESDDPLRGIPISDRRVMEVAVEAGTIPCFGAHGPQSCLVIQLPDGETETLVDGIYGYAHEEGVARNVRVQRLELDKTRPEKLPQDISTVQYRLIEG